MTFSITPHKYQWAHPLVRRIGKPPYIVVHHSGSPPTTTVDDIHAWHLANGWAGIAYHAIIYPSGKIVRGRPVWAMGAHTYAHNECLGICFVGNWDSTYKMPLLQKLAGVWLVLRWRRIFSIPKAHVKKHKDMSLNHTSCPGANFPFSKVVT